MRSGDVLYGRDQQQHVVTTVETVKRTAEVCSLSIEEHANFAVGDDGALVHNRCWTATVTHFTGRQVPNALKGLNIHGHHIVMKTITNDSRGQYIRNSQEILRRNGISLLATKPQVTRYAYANGYPHRYVKLDNLCYAANGYKQIHSLAYCQEVRRRLKIAELSGATAAAKKMNIINALDEMRDIMEAGGKFW